MIRYGILNCLCALLLFSMLFTHNVQAKDSSDFSGNWVLRLGNRPLVVVTLTPDPGHAGSFVGSLVGPKFSYMSGNMSFSQIKGSVVRNAIVRSEIKERCLAFTTQNPANQSDEDNYRLCPSGEGRGTLGLDFPSVEPWPAVREMEPPVVATDWESRQYFLDDTDVSNAEMRKIREEDWKSRQVPYEKIDWTVLDKADATRREATRKLLADGMLRTGTDFENAAYIFQHTGAAAEEFLLAHTLAMVAVTKGDANATFIAAESLDRYLQSIHQPQIYGTQTDLDHEHATQEPYNRGLISDSLRRLLNVPSQAVQEEQRKQYESQRTKQ